jgi:hypothetical protein
MSTGMSNQEIAQRLRLSVGTIKLHVHHILRKTGASSRTELVVQMIRRSSAAQPRVQMASDYKGPAADVHDAQRQAEEIFRLLQQAAKSA